MLTRRSRLAISGLGAGSASLVATRVHAWPVATSLHTTPVATRPRDRLALAAAAVAALALGASATGCSLAIHDAADQCSVDADCTDFDSSAVCRQGVCVASGLGPPGCFAGTPTTDAQLRRRCTSAQCISFDNCARLGMCGAPANLPPLKAPPQL